jgi:hypothetical protein
MPVRLHDDRALRKWRYLRHMGQAAHIGYQLWV